MKFPISFIKAGDEFSTYEKHIPAPYFRRNFFTDKPVTSAELLITGLGFYEAYFNGENITKGKLAPYRSNIDDYIYYDRYDLSDKITIGKNVIGVLLGNGMRNAPGGYVWDFDKARWRAAPQLAFIITLEFTDGETRVIESDTSVKTADSARNDHTDAIRINHFAAA